MISISSKDYKCWISSIVQLPTFYKPGTILYGSMHAVTRQVYEPLELEVHQGRDIEILPNLTKYKLEVVYGNTLCDVVGIATCPFDSQSIASYDVGNIPFFPIFIHFDRECFLFVDSINDLFSSTGIVSSGIDSNTIMSPIRMIQRIDDHLFPGHLEPMYDDRYARIQRRPGVLEILMCELNSDSGRTQDMANEMEMELGIQNEHIPLEIQMLGNVRSVGHLRNFLNPYGNVPSDVARMTMSSYSNWDQIRQHLQMINGLPDRVADIYMTEAEDYSYTGKWLSAVYTQPMNNFHFEIRRDYEQISDMFVKNFDVSNDFHQSFERIQDWGELLDYVELSFNLHGLFPNRKLDAQRSWMEDIVIKDADTGEILLYIDMIYWMLACADGLINTSILRQIDPLII